MTDWDLIVDLANDMGVPSVGGDWSGLDALTPLLERIIREGRVFLVKLDGDRPIDQYTAVLNRQPAEDWVVRRDDATLQDAVTFVLARYSEHRRKTHGR
jgi:hypothetical protein